MQPDAEAQNAYLEKHLWADYRAWHLGLTDCANDETKARHAFRLRAGVGGAPALAAVTRNALDCGCGLVQ